MSEEQFTMSPQTSVASAVKEEKNQLDRIEAKLDQLIAAIIKSDEADG